MFESAAAALNPPPSLQARPPTPPRESVNSGPKPGSLGLEKFHFTNSNHRRASAPAASSVTTDDSPVDNPGSSTKSGKKRVLWSEFTEYSDPPTASFDGKHITRMVQPLAPSSERKPSKSILKTYNVREQEYNGVGPNAKLLPLHHHASFAAMLDSIVQQLAGNDRSSKMDAYLMLSSTLKASENVPDLKALKLKMGILCQLIGQDLSQKLENGKPDTSLVVNALVLLSSFLQKHAVSAMFPAEFSVQLVDHSIKTFEEEAPSKEIIKHLMFILAQQNFSLKVMNEKRVGRLITALHNIGSHLKGKSIAMWRISIFRALLRQCRNHMMANSSWYVDMFDGMLNSLKEIRTQAIIFAFEAAITLGIESNATRAVTHVFAHQHDKESYAKHYTGKLEDMLRKKVDWDSATVPQIWSIVMLFFRSSPNALEQWQYFNSFLNIIQLCFNSSDIPTRTEANFAWNRFIFALQPNEKTSKKFRGLLSQALFTQLKSRKHGRKAALSSMNILLYYALRPQSSATQLEIYWDEYVAPLVDACLTFAKEREGPEVAKQEAMDACIILRCLFDTTTQRKWSETRAIDSLQQAVMSSSELPALDSKWLRKNHARVFKVLAPLMEKLYWDLGHDTPITRLWKTYIASISSPAVTEIRPHLDTMSCIASIFGMLHKFWTVGGEKLGNLPPANAFSTAEKSAAFLKGFECIISSTIAGLRLSPFEGERKISIAHDSFFAVDTPTHQQPRKIRNESRTPLKHLVLLWTSSSPGLQYSQPFMDMVHRVVSEFMGARPKKNAKMELIKSLFHLLPTDNRDSSRAIWQVLAGFAATIISMREDQDSGSDEQQLGVAYKELVEILRLGVNFSPNSIPHNWETLFDALITSVTINVGDAGRAIAVVEPLAKFFTTSVPDVDTESRGLFYLSFILESATYPKDRRALDAASRRLTGGPATQKPSTFDPYIHLYEYVRIGLETAYDTHSTDHLSENADIVSATTYLLRKCPVSLILPVLAKLQAGIACWIIDSEAKLDSGDFLSKEVATMWAMVKKLISQLLDDYSHSKVLNELEMLICAGLDSKHEGIFAGTIKFWNDYFGSCEEPLHYPDYIQEILLRVRRVAEIQLPSFPDDLDEDLSAETRQPRDFLDTQDSFYPPPEEESPMTKRLRSTTPQVLIQVSRSMSAKRSRESTPTFSKRKPRKPDVTPRLRHDDSQVQFEAIESSPMADRVMDSQLLTDKQKETKERQYADQAMFPDLKSTPVPREKSTPRGPELELPTHRSSSQLRTRNAGIDRDTTPSLVLPSDDDGFVASSPTPTRPIRDESRIVDPLSSLPEAASRRARPYKSPHKSPYLKATPSPNFSPVSENGQSVLVGKAVKPVADDEIPSSPPDTTSKGDETMDLDHTAEINEARLGLPELEPLNEGQEVVNETPSLGPSAQVNPFLFTNTTISSVQFSLTGRHKSPAEDAPSGQLIAPHREEEEPKSAMEIDSKESPPVGLDAELANLNESAMRPIYDSRPPGTPAQHSVNPISPPIGDFIDTNSSPASSDKQVFGDAVPSPFVLRGRPIPVQTPSTPTEFGNDSSLVRMMAEYDELVATRPVASRPVASPTNNSTRRSPRVSLSKSEIPPTPEVRIASARKSPLKQTTNARNLVDKEITYKSDALKSSSIASLIPDTPGVRARIPIIGDDGVEYNEEDTIVVDTSSLDRYQPRAKRDSKRGRKRKHPDLDGDSNEIPDSQDSAAVPDNTSPRKSSSKKKKRRGRRPKRASQIKHDESQSQEVDSSQDMYDGSVDLDAPVSGTNVDGTAVSFADAEMEDIDGEVARTSTQSSEHPVEGEHARSDKQILGEVESKLSSTGGVHGPKETLFRGLEFCQTTEESLIEDTMADLEPEIEQQVATEGSVDKGSSGSYGTNDPSVVIIEETRVEDSSFLRKSSSPVIEEKVIGDSISLDSSGSNAETGVRPEEEVVSREVVIVQASATEPGVFLGAQTNVEALVTVESMAHKLQSLLKDLQTASLSREDVNRLEDLFMDAKGHLYDAARRGRRSADKGL
ncbi:uncharacterized protein L3040_005196 [Drepanopeziza brunnea f. sp. 'multigermtubi']|uniref:uncharacterized protein n=1 Tax=Drepanopeziza brunnea f. sp. 'multigermtubi' TaxID=698441 RepID=UPI002398CE87|nr:hypothetical protein L3040_005196 [Drepanopeziza brunnea f. sp. 'multigermtubi']